MPFFNRQFQCALEHAVIQVQPADASMHP
jgi:hypothetical protein